MALRDMLKKRPLLKKFRGQEKEAPTFWDDMEYVEYDHKNQILFGEDSKGIIAEHPNVDAVCFENLERVTVTNVGDPFAELANGKVDFFDEKKLGFTAHVSEER